MTAISGFIAFDGAAASDQVCRAMSAAQSVYGPDDEALRVLGSAAFGRNLYRLLPEDAFDDQPLVGGDGRYLLVADIRIDNRGEIGAALGVTAGELPTLSDSALLLRAFERWHCGLLDRLVGDFAFALWDETSQELILARDILGQRPLHYHRSGGFVAVASMPCGIQATGRVSLKPDHRRVAEFVADLPRRGSASYFEGIERVEPGHVLTLSRHGIRKHRYWTPRRREVRYRDPRDYVEAFREQLDQATAARLRGSAGLVASHLSGGFDSSAVTATAARLLGDGGRVIAFTSAPRVGFDGPVPRGRVADESETAAATAALHPNIEHVVLRPSGADLFAPLERQHRLSQQPTGHICNNLWWAEINQEAARRGARIVLTGEIGNLTMSAGGRDQLADFIREGHWLRWWHEARAMVAKKRLRWTGVIDNSFGPWVPIPLYALLHGRYHRRPAEHKLPALVAARWSGKIGADASDVRSARPAANSYALRIDLLEMEDSGSYRKSALAYWGIDERDPTADRRLIEFCLSLPSDQLLHDGERRPLARCALADRLPQQVLDADRRGYQMADWYERFTKEKALATAAKLQACPSAREAVDFVAVDTLIAAWPTHGWDRQWVISEYRSGLLRALSAAHFLCTFETEAAAPLPESRSGA